MKMTAQHERFCELIVQGMDQGKAILESGASNSKTTSGAYAIASRLMKVPEIKARIAELRRAIAEKVIVDQVWITNKIVENTLAAMDEKKRDAANKGLELLGRTFGMFVDRKDIRVLAQFEGMSDRQLIDQMKTITLELEAEEADEPDEEEAA